MIAPPTQRTIISETSVDRTAVLMNATSRVINPAAANPYSTLFFLWYANLLDSTHTPLRFNLLPNFDREDGGGLLLLPPR